LRGQKLCNRF